MPEEVEIDTDPINEQIKQELEREGGWLLKAIALTTALFAALAALAALQAGGTANEALVLKAEATSLQAQASDQWSGYQAKSIKAAIVRESEVLIEAQGKLPAASFQEDRLRYAREQKQFEDVARTREHERDEKSLEADHLFRRHHKFADSVALFQVAIALGAVAALARFRLIWFLSMLLGIGGVLYFVAAF